MPHHLRGGFALFFGQVQQFPCDLVRRGQLGALPVDHRLPVEGREELRDIAQLAAQLACPGVSATRFRAWVRSGRPDAILRAQG
jgi:hypothetical protein